MMVVVFLEELKQNQIGKKAYPSCVLFNKDYLISGSVDGLVEVFDPCTAKHALLDYQIKENFIFVGSAVLSMTHSRDHQLLALGTEGGDLSVYEIASGKLIRLFSKAHLVEFRLFNSVQQIKVRS